MAAKKKRLVVIIILSVILVALIGGGYYEYTEYNRKPVDVSKKKGIPFQAVALYDLFVKDSVTANKQYLEKILEVSGEVVATSGTKGILLKTGTEGANINCDLKVAVSAMPAPGSQIKIRGICKGILSDAEMGLLGDVTLNSCIIVNE